MICGNTALLSESPDHQSKGRKLKFSRSIMGRFRRDGSLDRATRLKEAQDRRIGYLADLKKRDQQQERGNRHHVNSERPENNWLDRGEIHDQGVASAAGNMVGKAETAAGSPFPHGSQSSPRFQHASRRSSIPNRPSTTPAVSPTRTVSPARLRGLPQKENRQAANERAVRVYSAGARSCPSGGRSPHPPVVCRSPPWDDRTLPTSDDPHRRRLSPRENGRYPLPWPLDDIGVAGRRQVVSDVPHDGAMNSDGIGDLRKRPVRPATTGSGPRKRFARPMSAFSGRWDGDESFPDKPHRTIFSQACDENQEWLDGADELVLGEPTATPREHKTSSANQGRGCSPPARAQTPEETPAMQRARRLELQRLAIEKKELEAQLAEVKQLLRASKVPSTKAKSGGLPCEAIRETSPTKSHGERPARRRRSRRRRRHKRRSPATENDFVVHDGKKASPRRSRGKSEEGNGRRVEHPASPDRGRSASDSARDEGYRSPRRRRKDGGQPGRCDTRERHPQVIGSTRRNPERQAGSRKAVEATTIPSVALNSSVSIGRAASAGRVEGRSAQRGRHLDARREDYVSGRRLQRPKSASRRTRASPCPPAKSSIAYGSPPDNGGSEDGLFPKRRLGRRREESGSRRPASARRDRRFRAGDPTKHEQQLAARRRGDTSQDNEERRVYFSKFPVRGTRSAIRKGASSRRIDGGGSTSPSYHTTSKRTQSKQPIVDRGAKAVSLCDESRVEDATGAEDTQQHGYEDDFEVLSVRDSYDSDFEPWGKSESDEEQPMARHGSTEFPQSTQRVALDSRTRYSRVEPSAGREDDPQLEGRETSCDEWWGGNGFNLTNGSLLQDDDDDDESWFDGRPGATSISHASSPGAASWRVWNRPDEEHSRFALSHARDSNTPEAAAAHEGNLTGHRGVAAGFNHLWVDGCDNVLADSAEKEAADTDVPRAAGRSDPQNLDRELSSSSYEEYSVGTAGGPPFVPLPRMVVEDDNGKPDVFGKRQEEERVSTASMSDGGASLYDILGSSRDSSYSSETWSLESHDRPSVSGRGRSGFGAEAGMTTGAAYVSDPKASFHDRRNRRRYSAAEGESSDGSSLYDVTSETSVDEDNAPRDRDPCPPHEHGEADNITTDNSAYAVDPGRPNRPGMSLGPTSGDNDIPSESYAEPTTDESPTLCREEENPPASIESSWDQVSTDQLLPPHSGSRVKQTGHKAGGEDVDRRRPGGDGSVGRNDADESVPHDDRGRAESVGKRPQPGQPRAGGTRNGGDKIGAVDGDGFELNLSFDELSMAEGSSSLVEQPPAHDGAVEHGVADKQPFDQPSTGDEPRVGQIGSILERHMRNERPYAEDVPAHHRGSVDSGSHNRESQLDTDESLGQAWSLGSRAEEQHRRMSEEGSGVDVVTARGSSGDGLTNGAIGDRMAMENAESFDELSSLEKQYGSHGEESSGTQFEEAAKSYTEKSNHGAASVELDRNTTIGNYQLGQEESMDELSSLDKIREPHQDASVSGVPVGGSSIDEYFSGGARTVDNTAPGGIANNNQLQSEESLDELSSLDKQGKPYQDRSVGGVRTGREESFIGEYVNGSARTFDHTASGGIGSNGQLGNEESLDELSSLDKQPYRDGSVDEMPAGGEPPTDGNFDGGGRSTEDAAPGGIGSNGQLGNEESLDELSSLDKQPYQDGSVDEMPAGGEPPTDGNFDGGGRSIEDAAPGGIWSNGQLGNEESLDELSPLDKQPYQDGSVDEMPAGGEPPTDGNFDGGARSTEDAAPGGIGSNGQLGNEESLDELSPLDKQPYRDGSVDEMPAGGEPPPDGNFDGDASSIEDAAPGGIWSNGQLGNGESLDELSSLDKQPYRDGSVDEMPAGGEPPTDGNFDGGARSIEDAAPGGIGSNGQLGNEESLDELSSLDKQPYRDGSVYEMPAGGEPPTDGNFDGGASSVEDAAPGGIWSNGHLGNGESLDELSSLDEQREPYQDGSMDEMPAGGEPPTDGNFDGGASSVEDAAPGGIGSNGHLGNEESLDELSSLDKQPYRDGSVDEMPAGGEPPTDGNFDGDASSIEDAAPGGIGSNGQLGNEESLDELSSLDKQPYQDGSVDEMPAGGEPPTDGNFDGGGRSTEDAAPGGIGSNGQLSNEESLDELSSLDKQPYQDGSVDEMPAGGEPPTDGNFDGGGRSTEDAAPGGIWSNGQLGNEESLDELSSLDKQPYQDGSVDEMPAGGEPPPDGNFDGGASSVEDAAPGGIWSNGHLGNEESLDELSSLDKRPYRDGSVDEMPAGGEPPTDGNLDGGARSVEDAAPGGIGSNGQLGNGESLDELSSLDKQPYRDGSVDEMPAEGEPPTDGNFDGGGRSIEDAAPGGIGSNGQLGNEESLDELSSLDKQPYRDGSVYKMPAGGEPPTDGNFDGGARSIEDAAPGGIGSNGQLRNEESLDELSSLDEQGEPHQDGSVDEMPAEGGQPTDVNFDGGARRMKDEAPGDIGSDSRLGKEEFLDELSSLDKQGQPHREGSTEWVPPDQANNYGGKKRLSREQLDALEPASRPKYLGEEERVSGPREEEGEMSLDENLLDGHDSSFGDLLSLGRNSLDSGQSLSADKHSLDQSIGGLSPSDGNDSLLLDGISIGGSIVSEGGKSLSLGERSSSEDMVL